MRRVGIEVRPSALEELFVALTNLSQSDKQIAGNPWSKGIADRHPQLVRAVQSLWPDGAVLTRTGMELLVMGGVLGYLDDTSADRFLNDLPGLPDRILKTAGAYQPPPAIPDMEALLVDRFRELTDAQRMDHYAALARQVWEEVRPLWEEGGLTKVQGECALFQQSMAEGAHWLRLLHPQHPARMEVFAEVLPDWKEVRIAPSLQARGAHFFDLRGRLFLGYGMQLQSLLERSRQRAVKLALRMKAFSDPTRLTILSHLTKIPVSVSDLGKMLEISQPTVSEHLKLLRQAELVHVRREGTKAFYYADAAAIDQLLEQCREMLTRNR